MQVFYLACVSKSSVKPNRTAISHRKNKLIWYFRSSFNLMQLCYLPLQSTDTFFNLPDISYPYTQYMQWAFCLCWRKQLLTIY